MPSHTDEVSSVNAMHAFIEKPASRRNPQTHLNPHLIHHASIIHTGLA